MTYCSNCGNEISSEAQACDKCGAITYISPQQSSSFGRTILLIIAVSIALTFIFGIVMNLIVKM